jgi:hypothetical protein
MNNPSPVDLHKKGGMGKEGKGSERHLICPVRTMKWAALSFLHTAQGMLHGLPTTLSFYQVLWFKNGLSVSHQGFKLEAWFSIKRCGPF